MLRLLLFLIFIVVPAAEIAVFILVGGVIGVWPTLALIVLTALLGSALLKQQGTRVLARIRAEIDAGRVPGAELGHGAMILLAGVLLLTPGFVTDTAGFLLFVPAVRAAIWRRVKANLKTVIITTRRGHARPDGPVVDLDADEYGPPDESSPWRHGRDPRLSSR